MRSFVLSLGWIALFVCDQAGAAAGITYLGRILDPAGNPLQRNTVQFRMQIRTPSPTNCLMYEEIKTVDMTNSAGVFSLSLNDGNGTRTDTSHYTLQAIFGNTGSFSFVPSVCGGLDTYVPGATDGRVMWVSFNDGTFAGWEALPSQAINYVPSAIESYQVGGFPSSSLLRVADASGVPQTVAALTPTNFTELLALLNGTSARYVASSGAGAVLPNLSSNTPTAAGDIWFDSTTHQVKFYDGSSTQIVGTSGGSVTSVTTGAGLTGGPITSSGTISLATIGSGGSGATKINYDTFGRVTASASLLEGDIPNLVTPGKVSGNSMTSGTIGGSTAISTSGNVTAAAVSSTSGAFKTVELWKTDNSNKVTLSVPAGLSANYALTLPLNAGSPGHLLSTDGSGGLSWVPAPVGTVTNVTATAPVSVANGSSTPLISIAQSGTSADGYLSSADWNAFNNKLSVGAADSFYFKNAGNSFGAAAILGTNDNFALNLKANNAIAMTIPPSGNVGVGTATPATKLEVNGTLKIADGGETCSLAANGGMLRYNSGNMQFCNGSSWQTLGVSGAGLTSLNGQTGSTQTFATPGSSGTAPNWSSATNAHTLNIPMASTASVTAGLISNTDYTTFNAKLGTSSTFAGDVSGTSSTTSVDKLKGTALSITALATGNVLKYNGTNWVNTNLAAGDIPNLDWAKITSGRPTSLNGYGITDGVQNAGGVPSLSSGLESAIPSASAPGRIYVATDTKRTFRDNGTTWDQLNTNASDLASGALPIGRLPAFSGDVTSSAGSNSLTLNTVPLAKGGTGLTVGGTANQVLGMNAAATALEYKTLTAGAGVTISNSAGAFTISATGTGGTVTNVTSANSDISIATTTSTPVLTLNSGTAANQVVKLDAAAKLPAVDGSALTNLNAGAITSGTIAAARMPALTGDLTMTAGTTATTVAKIQSTPLTITTLTSGNFLKYNGTAWVNVTPSSADLSDAGSLIKSSQMPANCGAGQTLTFSSPTGTWTCSNITVTTGLTGILPIANGGTGTSDGSITGTGALTLAAGGTNQILSLNSSGTGSVNLGSSRGTSLSVFDGGNPTVNYVTIKGGVAGSAPVIGTGGADSNVNLILTPKGAGNTLISSGNLGIGTTNPGSVIDIQKDQAGAGTTIRVKNGDASAATYSSVEAHGDTAQTRIAQFASGAGGAGQLLSNSLTLLIDNNNSAGGVIAFRIGSTPTEKMRIASDGSLGVGTTSPAARLDVVNNGYQVLRVKNAATAGDRTATFAVENGNATATQWSFSVGGTANGAGITGGQFYFERYGLGPVMLLDTNGNVGIGTNTPSYKLHVVGTAGLSSGTAWTNASDVRLKDIHGDYDRGLDEVLKLHTVRYSYKKDNALGLPPDFEKTGFIAQEVQKVIPEAVNERKDGYLELNVDPIHWAVVNAVKELYARWWGDSQNLRADLAEKTRQIRELSSENEVLKSRLDRLERKLDEHVSGRK